MRRAGKIYQKASVTTMAELFRNALSPSLQKRLPGDRSTLCILITRTFWPDCNNEHGDSLNWTLRVLSVLCASAVYVFLYRRGRRRYAENPWLGLL